MRKQACTCILYHVKAMYQDYIRMLLPEGLLLAQITAKSGKREN